MVRINLSKPSHHNCPSFERCNTNRCPLHQDYPKLGDFAEDKVLMGWKRCRASKKVRMEIGQAFKLKWKGLTFKEIDNIKKSLEMKKEIFLTRDKKLKTPQTALFDNNSEVGGDENATP